jgi:CubicO group peptidase (beta-lactamase class C family)
MTKPVTGTAVLMRRGEGELSVDDPVIDPARKRIECLTRYYQALSEWRSKSYGR